jgi:four helix bundle protein
VPLRFHRSLALKFFWLSLFREKPKKIQRKDLPMKPAKTFTTLELAIEFYGMVRPLKLPAHHRDQLLRAASSIALNLSEGNAKLSVKDKKRFYQISLGSLRECQTILRLENLSNPKLLDRADHIGACLYRLISAL